MDIAQFIAQFIYRIRYWLLWGTMLVTGLTIYFTQFLPYSYTSEGSMFAGMTSATNMDGSAISVVVINSTFDNLIGLAKSQSTLSKVSIRLLANAYSYGEEWKDNHYIEAKHYRQLLAITPKEVLELVDRNDVNKTAENLTNYRKEDRSNFVYALFAGGAEFYSFKALDGVITKRSGTSDILNFEYTCSDPGIAQQTLKILIEELMKAYEILRFKATNDVIAYFEEQVRLTKIRLNEEEDKLMHYCIQERIINYGEESEALSVTRYAVDDRKEAATRTYEAALALRKMLDEKMDIRAKMMRDNTRLLNDLNTVSELSQNIVEQEVFTKHPENSVKMKNDKAKLKEVEDRISHLTDNLNEYSFSKEGVGIQDMITQWLHALINETKAQAELKVLNDRQQDILDQYSHMSPIGTQVGRMNRAIDIAEDNYRAMLHALNEAILRKRNIEMTTSNLEVISEPAYPLTDNGRKRFVFILVAFLGSLALITTYFLLIELLDRTLRDAYRSQRLTGLPVISAFNGVSNLKFRGFLKACNRVAAAHCCRRLNEFLVPSRPTVINLFSFYQGEGKSFLSQYFADYWDLEGLKVRLVKYGEDFQPESMRYVAAQNLSSFWQKNEAEEEPDIILVEYPAASNASLPLAAMKHSDVNLLVANACRLWSQSDTHLLKPMKEEIGDTPFFLYLNNADLEVVESFTGNLPPKTSVHSLLNRLAQLGLTAKQAAVK